MAPIREISGQVRPAADGTRWQALSMYEKGKAFLGASLLLQQRASTEAMQYVTLHLLCQGMEASLKGLLLLRDFDRYRAKLRKPLGHNLTLIADEAVKCYGLRPLRPALRKELDALNTLYGHHLLRYGSIHDIFVDPATIPTTRVWRSLHATLRISERALRRSSGVI